MSIEASVRREMLLSPKIWMFRVLAIAGLVALCWLDRTPIPAFAFGLSWGPNGLFLIAFMNGVLHLPRSLEPVHAIEPKAYRWLGVGLVKRVVATRAWPLICLMEPPPKLTSRSEFLAHTELSTKGAEICHGATFILAFLVALMFLAASQTSAALWILAFNLVFNGYPVMLQRSNRWRIQQIRAVP